MAEIARGTAEQFRRLCVAEPRVALLSFSTRGSAQHESIDKIRQALEIVRATGPDFEIDGELQGDAALVQSIGASKAPGSTVASNATEAYSAAHKAPIISNGSCAGGGAGAGL